MAGHRFRSLLAPGAPVWMLNPGGASLDVVDLLARSGVGRDINRHHYTRAEIDAALDRPVVRQLLELIRLRNRHPAFGGTFELLDGDDSQLSMQWKAGPHWARLDVDLSAPHGTVQCEGPDGPQRFRLGA